MGYNRVIGGHLGTKVYRNLPKGESYGIDDR